MFDLFKKYQDHGDADFSLQRSTLTFRDKEQEYRFNNYYFESNLQIGRWCHLIAIFLYCSIGLWDGLVIEPARLPISIMVISAVTLIFLGGLLLSYRNLELYKKYWQPLYSFYVMATGTGITIIATMADSIPVYNFVGIIFCLFFCYAFIRLTFTWAAAAGNLIIFIYTGGIIFYSDLDYVIISTNLIYMAGINILGMTICYALELMSRRDFMFNELLKNAEAETKTINTRLEKMVCKRTRELQKSLEALEQGETLAGLGYFERDWKTGEGFWSKGMYRLCGYKEQTEKAPSLNNFLESVDKEDRENFLKTIQQSRETGEPFELEFKIARVDGSTANLHSYAFSYLDEIGEPLLTRGVIRDVTDTKKAEENFKLVEAQLIQAQKMESIGRLAGGVAHDYNNVSSIIIGYSELAMDELDKTDPMYESFEEIYKAAKRSSAITRQLLAFARKQTTSPKVLNLNNTMQDMLKMLRRLIGEDIELTWLPGENLWPIFVDASQVDQILANLCVNARDAIEGNGKITIETSNCTFDESYSQTHSYVVPGNYVCLALSDNGSGIEKEHLDNIFEPFYTTKETGKGTGLGLATVYGIMKQNKGFVNVYSEPGQGTTIKIYFPEKSRKISKSKTTLRETLPQGRGEVILLVEDDEPILKVATKMLVGQGYTVYIARGPKEAIRLHKEKSSDIDLLITDVVMPEMNGKELANLLQAENRRLQVLFMSGYTSNVIAERGVLEEGIQFIQKPFSRSELAAKVRNTLDGATRSP